MSLFIKIKDLFNLQKDGKQKHQRRFLRFVIILSSFVSFYLIFFNSGKNLIRYISSKYEIARQERLIKKYQENIKQMDKKIKELSTSKDSLELFAREKFYFSAPDEDVYIIEN